MPTSKELRQQRAELVAKARAIQNKADAENKRDLTGEECQEFDRLMTEADRTKGEIDQVERRERLDTDEAELRAATGRRSRPGERGGGDRITEADFRESFRAWCLGGSKNAARDADTIHRASRCGISLHSNSLELRDIGTTDTNAGAETVATTMAAGIVEKMAFFNPIRQKAGYLSTATGANLDYPRADDTANSAVIVDEHAEHLTDADPATDKVTLKSFMYSTKIVRCSLQLLTDMNVDVVTLLSGMFGRRMGRGQAAHFVTGNGTTQPQGLATGASVGVNLDSGNALTGDKLIDLVHSVDRDYRLGAEFLFHDATLAALRKLKDGDGQYLWQPGLTEGSPDRLLGYPVDASNSLTSIASPGDNQKLGLFGNIRDNYLVRDVAGSMTFTRLNELYAAFGDVGFVMLMRSDGRYIGHSGCIKSLNSFDAP